MAKAKDIKVGSILCWNNFKTMELVIKTKSSKATMLDVTSIVIYDKKYPKTILESYEYSLALQLENKNFSIIK